MEKRNFSTSPNGSVEVTKMDLTEVLGELYQSSVNDAGDVILISKEKEMFKVHRMVLIVQSRVFRDLFADQCHHLELAVSLPFTSKVISTFVKFCYFGEIQIEMSLVKELNELFDELKVEQAKEIIRSQKLTEDENVAIKSEEFIEKSRLVEFEFFDETEFEGNEEIKEEYLNEAQFEPKDIKYESLYHVIEEIPATENQELKESSKKFEKIKDFPLIKKPMKASSSSIVFPAQQINLTQLKEEQERFKRRLQDAINFSKKNSCGKSSVKKAAKLFGVPEEAIFRNLRGFKLNTS